MNKDQSISPLNGSFLINLEGISDELSDVGFQYATKEIRINSIEEQFEFCISRTFSLVGYKSDFLFKYLYFMENVIYYLWVKN